MRVIRPGKIRENLWLLGCKESCVYLIEGSRESMIISGGMNYIVPDLMGQIEEFGIQETKIKKLLILHSHFDHVGVVPFLKRRNGELELLGSARSWEILRMPKAIETINRFSRDVAKRNGREEVYRSHDVEWREFYHGNTVSEGDSIDLGGLSCRIYETPGHSSCAVSLYIPEYKALFASDCMGIPFRDRIICSANSNFTKYQRSLEKLAKLDTEYVCADHYGYISGDEAVDYISECISATRDYRSYLEDKYRRVGDIGAAARETAQDFFEEYSDYFLDPKIMEAIYSQLFRHISAGMGEEGKE